MLRILILLAASGPFFQLAAGADNFSLPMVAAASWGQSHSEMSIRLDDPENSPRLLVEPLASPRQLLNLLDVGTSDLEAFVDGQRVSAVDEEVLLKILFRLPQFGQAEIDRWLQREIPWRSLCAEPARHRASFFLIRGRAKSIRRVQITASQSSRWDFEHYFEVVVQLDDLQRAVVCCRTLPSAWQDHTTLDQPCRVQAMFLKAIKSDGPKSPPAESQTAESQTAESQTAESQPPTFQPLFVAQRIAWLPDHQNSEMGIGPDQLLLSQLGMDQGLFDLVRRRNGLPISGSERACFYSLLRAVERASAQQLTEGSKQLELQSLLQTPARFHGDLFHTAGSVRRITRVAVKEEDIQQLYGIDHYYQLDVLLSLSDTEIRISGDSDQAGPVYDISFPLTCCVRSVPTAWQSLVGKEDINVTGVFDGFFYKVWTYSNPYVGSFDPRNRQLSPMLMTSEPRIVVVRQSSRSGVGLAVGIGFLVLLGLLWALVWRVHRSDAAYARILRRREPSTERPDFKRFPPSQP